MPPRKSVVSLFEKGTPSSMVGDSADTIELVYNSSFPFVAM